MFILAFALCEECQNNLVINKNAQNYLSKVFLIFLIKFLGCFKINKSQIPKRQ